jgi:hypothetical protein
VSQTAALPFRGPLLRNGFHPVFEPRRTANPVQRVRRAAFERRDVIEGVVGSEQQHIARDLWQSVQFPFASRDRE